MNKIRLFNIIKIILPIFIIFLLSQCMQDEYNFDKLDTDVEIKAGILTPLAYGSLNLEDLISEFDTSSYINTYPDGLLYITYADSLFSFIADDLLEVPDQDFIELFIESAFAFPPVWTTIPIDRKDNFPFTFANGEQIDSIQLDQGNMVFNISSDFQHTGLIQMVFPNIRLGSDTLKYTINITDPSGTFSSNNTIPLDGYTIILQDSVGTDTTFLPVDFHIELYNEGNPILPTDKITIVATIEDLNFDGIFGYIGDYELITQTGEMDLGFFENTFDGTIRFANPQINFNITNSYGVPASVNISRFTGFKTDIDSIQMTFDPSVNPFNYAYPTLADYNNNYDIFKDTTISINGDNSNVSYFLEELPSRLVYNLSAASNPDGPGAAYNFVTDDSKIDVGFEFILPLEFSANNFAFVDTIDLDLIGIDDDIGFIERINVMLEISNGLPMDIDFQLYFLDELYNHVDTLFADEARPIIASGILAPDNSVLSPNVKVSVIQYTGDDITNLNTVKYGIIRAGLKTPTVNSVEVPVKFYSDYSVDFNISVGVDVKADSNDF